MCEIKTSESEVVRVVKKQKLSDGHQAKVYTCAYYPISSESVVVKLSKRDDEHRILQRLQNCAGVVPVNFMGTVNYSTNKYRFALGMSLLVTLGDYFKRHAVDDDDSKRIAQSLLSSLREIHQRQVIHRDIKPSNILVTPDLSHIYVSDFDCASTNYNHTRKRKRSSESGFVGTRMFASRSAICCQSPSIDDDYESLCYTLYWLRHPNTHRDWKNNNDNRPKLEDMIQNDDVVKYIYDAWQLVRKDMVN